MTPDKFIIDHAELKRIWLEKGPHPKYHDHVKANLKDKWPLLYDFIDRIVSHPTP